MVVSDSFIVVQDAVLPVSVLLELLHPPHHPLDQFLSHSAYIVISSAGIVDGTGLSHHLKVYPFLVGLSGGVIHVQ